MAEQIANELERLTAPHRPCRLTAVKLQVGALRQVVAELLTFALEAIWAETPDRDAAVTIEAVRPRGHCNACGRDFVFADWAMQCPACESVNVKSHGGDELVIETLTIEKEDGSSA